MRAAVKPPDLQSTGVQEEVAQLIDPQYPQGAHGPDSIAADTNQLADTTEKVELIEIISDEAATESHGRCHHLQEPRSGVHGSQQQSGAQSPRRRTLKMETLRCIPTQVWAFSHL